MAFLDVEKRRNTVVSTNSGTTQPMDESIHMASSLGIMKPGFTRINLAYFMPDEEIEFLLAAVNIVANEGWKLLPQYAYDVEHGSWHHRSSKNVYNLMTLDDITYNYGDEFHMVVKGNINPRSEPGKRQSFSEIMKKARRIIESADTVGRKLYPFDEITMKEYLPEGLLPYIWWLEPQYAMLSINNQSTKSLTRMKQASIPLKPRIASGPISNAALSSRYPKIRLNENLAQLTKATPVLDSHIKKIPDRVREWVKQSSSSNVTGKDGEMVKQLVSYPISTSSRCSSFYSFELYTLRSPFKFPQLGRWYE